MKRWLQVLFTLVLISMVLVTFTAIRERGMLEAGHSLWPDAWFRATLADAYFGFVTFFVWVVYKERRPGRQALWFILIMSLGNLAMASYVLIELRKLQPGDSIELLLTRRNL